MSCCLEKLHWPPVIQTLPIPLGCSPELHKKTFSEDTTYRGFKLQRHLSGTELKASSLLMRFRIAKRNQVDLGEEGISDLTQL